MPVNNELKRKILVGCDPELFLTEVSTGKFVSAHDKLQGTKEKPHPVDFGAVQVDGVAAEFNITPAPSRDHFLTYVNAVVQTLQSHVGVKYKLTVVPTATFDAEYWDTLPKLTKTLGCNPDFNGWTGQVNPSPNADGRMRTASGHVHGGWTKHDMNILDQDHIEDCSILAKQLDHYLGVYSLIWDADTKRRELYGKAGTFRAKPYGIEYRVLSNRWLSSPDLIKFVYVQTYKCIQDLLQGQKQLDEEFGELARQVIDGSVPWWEDKNHKLWRLSSTATGVDVHKLLEYKDKAWDVKTPEVKVEKKKPKANFYKQKIAS